jgi:hypothetical protein
VCISLHNRDLDSLHVTNGFSFYTWWRPLLWDDLFLLRVVCCSSWSKLKNKYFRAWLHLPFRQQHTHRARAFFFYFVFYTSLSFCLRDVIHMQRRAERQRFQVRSILMRKFYIIFIHFWTMLVGCGCTVSIVSVKQSMIYLHVSHFSYIQKRYVPVCLRFFSFYLVLLFELSTLYTTLIET